MTRRRLLTLLNRRRRLEGECVSVLCVSEVLIYLKLGSFGAKWETYPFKEAPIGLYVTLLILIHRSCVHSQYAMVPKERRCSPHYARDTLDTDCRNHISKPHL